MKVKLKDAPIPRWNSFCLLGSKNWEKLNAGETVELKKIPKPAKRYLTEVKNGS